MRDAPSAGMRGAAKLVRPELVAVLFLVGATAAGAGQDPDHLTRADAVISLLNQTASWYRETRAVPRTSLAREDDQTALAVLQRAFDTARAQAALVATEKKPSTGEQVAEAAPRVGKRAEITATIQSDLQELRRLEQRFRTTPPNRRAAVRSQIAAATNRLELDRTRLDFLTKLERSDVSAANDEVDLAHQVEAMQASVPELRSTPASPPSPRPTTEADRPAEGTWALIRQLFEMSERGDAIDRLTQSTGALKRSIDNELHATEESLRQIVGRLRALAADPTGGESLVSGQRAFRDQLDRSKHLEEVLLSLRAESALFRRYAADLEGWRGAMERERRHVLQSLGVGLIGVVIAAGAILVGGVLWRVAAERYVQDAYRRRLLLMARNVVTVTALALVLLFHFASELTTLVTGLGFAAAGIAFALQTVILAIAGYFSMVAPNGIRLGDRVSLQGPFGYVQGEVLDIGLVRIRLRELAGEPLRPTGRIVVFPNSVVFTGSFFKHPPPEGRADRPRAVEPGAA